MESFTASTACPTPSPTASTAFSVWSPTQSVYQQAYGLEEPQRFAQLEDAMRRSPYWTPVYQRGGTVLFQFDRARYAAENG